MRLPFSHRLRARYSDCDPQGIVFNANYLTYFDIAITELWREAAGPYDEVMRAHGVDLVVAAASVRYLAPIRFDEEVDLRAGVAHLGTTSIITSTAIDHLDGRRAAEGELRHVVVGYGTAEKTPMPDELRAALSRFAVDGRPGSDREPA